MGLYRKYFAQDYIKSRANNGDTTDTEIQIPTGNFHI